MRLGTPALTSRGFTTSDMDGVAEMISDVLSATSARPTKEGKPGKARYDLSDDVVANTRTQADALLSTRPLYPGLTL